MRSFESNRAFVRACLAEMPDYERAGKIFWTLSALPPAGTPAFLQMTLGNIILALDEIRALEPGLKANERTVLEQLLGEWRAIRAGASARLEHLAMREADSRIAQFRTYTSEALERGDLSDYAANVRPRLCALRLLEWLGADHPGVRIAHQELAAIDLRLTPRMEAGPFVLEHELAAVYPPAPAYHFLRQRPLPSKDAS